MILMSKYKGQHGEKRVKKFGQGPPPLFGQCPKEIDFFYGMCSLIYLLLLFIVFIFNLRYL